MALDARLAVLGRELAGRESANSAALESARRFSQGLHVRVGAALEAFHAEVASEAPQLSVRLSEPRVDDKHLHAVQFELLRGSHRAIVTTASRGRVTLVGPFQAGKAEGPCRRLAMEWNDEMAAALEDFLVAFVEGAAAP